MKKVLIVASSLRHSANSAILADEFARGATEAGHSVAMISLAGKSINFCKGCLACQQTQACVIQDSMAEILEQLRTADVIVFATPIYFYELSGQLKTLLDRCNPLFPQAYRFRDVYLLTAAADDNPHTPEKAVSCLTGWIDCFPKSRLAGTVFAGGVTDEGDIGNHKALDEAFEAGRHV